VRTRWRSTILWRNYRAALWSILWTLPTEDWLKQARTIITSPQRGHTLPLLPPAEDTPYNFSPQRGYTLQFLPPAGIHPTTPPPSGDTPYHSSPQRGHTLPLLPPAGIHPTTPPPSGGYTLQFLPPAGIHPTISPPSGYALPTCHAALGRTASAPRGAGFQPAWRHPLHRRQVLAVAAGAQARIACNITVYAQVSHACSTDSMIETNTSSFSVTRMGNGMPRTGS
jgi:hypothetical protein